jgi:hypothetical protein
MPNPGDALLDASTYVRSSNLIHEGKVSVSTVFCLSTLLDAVAFQEELFTLFPNTSDIFGERERNAFTARLERLGLSPKELTLPKKIWTRIVRYENAAKDLDFGVIRWDKDGSPVIDGSAVDPPAAYFSRNEFQFAGDSREDHSPEDPAYQLRSEIGGPFRSVYERFGITAEGRLFARLNQLGTNFVQDQYIREAVCYLGFRSELYLSLAADYNLPYLPDSLRSYMLAKGVPAGLNRIQSVAQNTLLRLDSQISERRQGLRKFPELPPFPVSTPSALALVLQRAKSPDDIIPQALQLRESRAGTKLRGHLSKVQALLTESAGKRAEAASELEKADDFTQDVVHEYYPGKSPRSVAIPATKLAYQLFVSVLSGLISDGPAIRRGGVSTATFLSSLDTEKFVRFLSRRRLVCIRNPLVEGSVTRDVTTELKRLFGTSLSADELLMLRKLRRMPTQRV